MMRTATTDGYSSEALSIPQELRRAREKRGLTQEQAWEWFSERLRSRGQSLTVGGYGNWERGESKPHVSKADLIAEFIERDIWEVLRAIGAHLFPVPKAEGRSRNESGAAEKKPQKKRTIKKAASNQRSASKEGGSERLLSHYPKVAFDLHKRVGSSAKIGAAAA